MVQCCINGDVNRLKRWAKRGVRVHSTEPLCEASLYGKLAVVRCLVKDLGADVSLADEKGRTPVSIAAAEGDEAIMRCLAGEFGADVNITMDDGASPVYMAAQNGFEAVVRCLVKEFGADVNQATHSGCTPLFTAAQESHEAVVLCLVKELGANVDQIMHDECTPLMVAAHMKHEHTVRLLLKLGADPQALHPELGTAAEISKNAGAPVEQNAYLEAKTHCSNPGCTGAGRKTCAECKHARYCSLECQHAHWPAHKAECKVAAKARVRAAKGK
jgi:ankyrin repeat protein